MRNKQLLILLITFLTITLIAPIASARVFNSDLGMWQTRDPLEFSDGSNFYAYTRNSPIDNTDPTGLITVAQCSSDRAWCALYDPIVNALSSQLRKKGCGVPVTTCKNCPLGPGGNPEAEPGGGGGPRDPNGYFTCGNKGTKSSITLCANVLGNRGSVCRTMAHELVHAIDACNGKICNPFAIPFLTNSRCRALACSEIRAYSLSGNCCPRNPANPWLKGPGGLIPCVRNGAIGSLTAAGCGATAAADVKRMWSKCFNYGAACGACKTLAPWWPIF